MAVPIVRRYVEHAGIKYFEEGNYWRASRGGPGHGKLLHVVIYEETFGPVPPGHHVHHKDHNGHNNEPSNLVALTPSQHKRYHGVSGAFAARGIGESVKRKEEWAQRKPRAYICQKCGKSFESIGTRAKNCTDCGKRLPYRDRSPYSGLQPDGGGSA